MDLNIIVCEYVEWKYVPYVGEKLPGSDGYLQECQYVFGIHKIRGLAQLSQRP
jgi:hypothetical protein